MTGIVHGRVGKHVTDQRIGCVEPETVVHAQRLARARRGKTVEPTTSTAARIGTCMKKSVRAEGLNEVPTPAPRAPPAREPLPYVNKKARTFGRATFLPRFNEFVAAADMSKKGAFSGGPERVERHESRK